MTAKKIKWIFLSSVMLLLAAGCNCSNAQIGIFEIITTSPIGGEIVSSLNPTFDWHGSDSCEPDKYRLNIREDIQYGADSAYADVAGNGLPYSLSGDSLLPGRSYYWYAQAVNEYTSPEDTGAHGPESAQAHFFTGPVCSGETLVPPELEYPRQYGGGEEFDNWITHNHLQKFKWTYNGGCLPISYDYQFATDPGFTDIVLSGTTTKPYAQSTNQTFPNCSTLFWRVAANDGSTVGLWSESFNFHWVRKGTSCYQTHYISDDAANIRVLLYEDVCHKTGFEMGTRTLLDSGCVSGKGGFVSADGIHTSQDKRLDDFRVDLGPGPCPSTGLDQKKFGYNFFHVLTPGTYCISISNNQTVDSYGSDVNLKWGIWTDPRTDAAVAGKTIEFGPGVHDVVVEFGWDPIDISYIPFPVPENIFCRKGPDPICDPLGIALEGEILPLIARDRFTEWKMTSYNGQQCFVYLASQDIDIALAEQIGSQWRTEDLPIFDPQPPCPTPTPEPRERAVNCSALTTQSACVVAGCTWNPSHVTPGGYCSDN